VDQIREKLDRLSDLSPEELQALQDSIVAEFGTLSDSVGDSPTRETVDAMNELADANDVVTGEQDRRVAEAAELATAAEAAVARFNEATSDNSDSPIDEADLAAEETPEEEATETPEEEAQEPADAAPADAPAPAPGAPAEGTPEEEAGETPAQEAAEPAPAEGSPEEEAEETPEEEDAEKKDLKPFSADTETVSEAVADAPVESEASAAEPEAETVPAESEASLEETPEAEFSAEETVIENAEEFSAQDSNTESSEEPVTASNTPNELEFEAPAELRPATLKAAAPVVITAGADLPGITAGSEFSSMSEVAQALLSRKHGMNRTSGGDGEQHTIATFSTTFPESRRLNANDIEGNRAKINAIVSPEAIVAAGGLTAPVETSYDIFELGETSVRPVRDALAVFGADRGGLRFMTPPVLADLAGAVSVWTMQDDIDASTPESPNPVKPCLRVAAGVEVIVYTDAIPLCLTFGNLGARAYPELVERHTQLAMVQQARFAETRLLTRIGALSTQVTAAAELGAARDIFVQIEQAAAAYRSRYRLDPSSPLRTIFPEWFKNALRADLTKQLPGDGRDGTFNLAEAEINKWFTTRNINVSWHLDGETGQIFGAQADGALLGFPTNVIWYLFSEGTFLFLDGGTLDLGLVRDSTLNGTNDYKVFVETFEGVAKVGVESLRVASVLKIKGASSSTVAVAG
jgi:chemotaxis protein histidine kinase CheA